MENKFIVVEGIDGAGKTTICDFISEMYGYHKMKSPEGVFEQMSSSVNTNYVSVSERFAFYSGSNINSSIKISSLLLQNKKVVIDRYYYSTIVYHEVSSPGISSLVPSVFSSLVKPDLILYLKSDLDIIINRLSSRKKTRNDKIYLTSENYLKIDKEYRKVFDSDYIEVDNNADLLTTKETIAKILSR